MVEREIVVMMVIIMRKKNWKISFSYKKRLKKTKKKLTKPSKL